MTRIEREKRTVRQMIALYCRGKHGGRELCPSCESLWRYACQRLDRCMFGNAKTDCQRCPVHCYARTQREAIRQVMRYAGPRMMFHHPLAALRHLLGKLKVKN